MTPNQRRINATYHFLGLLFFIMPIIGMAAPALFSVIRKYASIDERNHYRGILNFLISLLIYYVMAFLIFPDGVALSVVLIFSVISAMLITYNGVLALQGEAPSYPLSLPILKPEVKTVSIDDLMLQQRGE